MRTTLHYRQLIGTLVTAAGLAFAGSATASSSEHSHDRHSAGGRDKHHASGHDKHHADAPRLSLNHGKRWRTDEPLRAGMNNIRTAFAADLKLIHAGKLTPDQYAALAHKVNGEVASMVQNCKLDKEADEQLHVVIAELLGGAEAMEGKDRNATPRAGAERVARALNLYGRYFDHKGWRNL